MGGRRWSEKDIRELKMIYRYKTLSQMSEFLKRPEAGVKFKLMELGINLTRDRGHLRVNPRDGWSDEEVRILKKYIGKKDSNEISRYLNRTPKAIKHKALCLGYSLKKSSWTRVEMDILLARRENGVSWSDISVELGKTARACQGKFYYLHGK